MRATLFPFQETALADLHDKITKAHTMWSEKDPQVISLSAPTGAGKTIIMTALFEDIIFGHAYGVKEPDSVFVWLSDMPELNEQTRLKEETVKTVEQALRDSEAIAPTETGTHIDFSLGDDAQTFDCHLFIPDENGNFKASLNDWETGVVKEELANGAVAWLRNLDRKKWSLEIPYEVGGVTTSMFPDLIVVHAGNYGNEFDVLEPHDPSRQDNDPKAVGLAKFAEKHGEKFGRIQLIRESKRHRFRRDGHY
jgi:hypothetical protein